MKLKPSGAGTHARNPHDSFNELREKADRERRSRRADPEVQDGSYGFDEQGDTLQTTGQFYSDQMMVDAPGQNQNRWRRQR